MICFCQDFLNRALFMKSFVPTVSRKPCRTPKVISYIMQKGEISSPFGGYERSF